MSGQVVTCPDCNHMTCVHSVWGQVDLVSCVTYDNVSESYDYDHSSLYSLGMIFYPVDNQFDSLTRQQVVPDCYVGYYYV